MKFIYKGFFVICCLFASLPVLAAFLPRPTQSAAASPVPVPLLRTAAIQETGPPFSAKVIAQIGRQSPKWQEVKFDNDNTAKMVALTINYRRRPSGFGEVEADTRRVAQFPRQKASWLHFRSNLGKLHADVIHVPLHRPQYVKKVDHGL